MRVRIMFLAVAIATALGSAPGLAQNQPPSPEPAPSFFDDFSRLDDARWEVSDGWSNGAHQICTWSREAIEVADGRAVLSLKGGPQGYRCGELQTRRSYGFGTYEVRMRAARGSGVISAFFTYTGPVRRDPHDEVDIEILGKDTNAAFLNVFTAGRTGREHTVRLPADAAATMIDYAFEWLPDRIRWFVDGRLVHQVERTTGELPTHPGKLYLSLWNSRGLDAWSGPFRETGQTLRMEVDHVAFTRAGERCHFPTSIVCRLER